MLNLTFTSSVPKSVRFPFSRNPNFITKTGTYYFNNIVYVIKY